MGNFSCLEKTKSSKKQYNYNFNKIYKKGRFATTVNYDFFEDMYTQELLNFNKKKKYDQDLLELWAKLDIRTYIDFDLGNTINLYLNDTPILLPIKNLPDYNFIPEDSRKLNLLEIMFIKNLKLENIEFKNIYLACFEITDINNEFRPYVLLFIKNNNNEFVQIGYGYDSNNNSNVELFINSFNYPIFLTTKGFILLPITNKKIKLNVYDYINENDVEKIMPKKIE